VDGLRAVRRAFPGWLHLFGVGGTATLHLAALLGIDSLDSSGWRNRAARGIVQLPGTGDRMVANLGSWRGRTPSPEEWTLLEGCPCPACRAAGPDGLRAGKLAGFQHRATHNLWTLLEEARQIQCHLHDGSYTTWYPTHINNSIYQPLIDLAVCQGDA
jgi:tRNA-guanine family transglycosylase